VPSFADLHIEFVFTVLNRFAVGDSLAGWLLGWEWWRGAGQCYIISRWGVSQVL